MYPKLMRIAVISDVHANLLALDAVLADLRQASPVLLVNLGDLVSGPFDPQGAADAQAAGWPAYSDDVPVSHSVEVGCPHARYALVNQVADGWSVELRAVPYDWEAAANQAERHGRHDIAFAVRTGRVPSVSC